MIIVLTGPTGSGKSELAVSLANRIGASIINADAFQVYKELNIATAKPSESLRMKAPHYLFDFVPLDSDYNVAEYQADLRAELAELNKRGQDNVIIAGGTGLYIRAGLYDYEFPSRAPADLSRYDGLSDEKLHQKLQELDPEEAKRIHPHNRRRVLRALSFYEENGQRKSEFVSSQEHRPLYPTLFFGLEKEREDLYALCDERVEKMFAAGLVEENRTLVERYGRDCHAFQAIGVKELFPYFDGEISLNEAKALIKKNTRNYIKRQLTFFRHQFPLSWIHDETEIMEVLQGK